jgi:AcrR family transcriptional regulator
VARRRSERPAPGDRTRGALLTAAYELIAEKGLGGLRTRDVVERAGVNISMLHYYFGSKEGLLVAVAKHAREQFTGPSGERPLETLGEHLAAARRSFADDPRLTVVLHELSLQAQRDAGIREALAEIHRGWNEVVARIVRHEQALGRRSPELDPLRAAQVVTSFIIGAMLQLGVNPAAFEFSALAEELDRRLAAV